MNSQNQSVVLKTENLGIAFGGLQALSNFELEVAGHELIGLIGPNGAGKTTVFNLLTGIYKPTSGKIYIDGVETEARKANEMVKKGIVRTFQNIRLFKKLTVLENVKTAFNKDMKYSVLSALFRLPSYWREEQSTDEKARALLEVFELSGDADTQAGNLPYGKQRKLEIARALATSPKALLLDEPAAGMNPTETAELMATIRLIRDKFGLAVVLIEHDMSLVMGICERIVVLDHGQIIARGTPYEVANNPQVITAYLGQ